MFAFGYVLQRGLLNLTLGDDILPPLLVTFGLSIVIQNVLLETFSADTRRLQAGGLETASIELAGGLAVGTYPLLLFFVAVGVIALLQVLFYRTRIGRVFRATSDKPLIVRPDGRGQPQGVRTGDGHRARGLRPRRAS